jgi:hypothetical protein
MLTKMLAASAAFSMLAFGGSALAAQAKASAQLGPKQPIPYSRLEAYSKASPKAQANKDWSAAASTGTSTDTSATLPPATSSAPDTAVNPAPSVAPPSLPMTPPTNAPMTEDKMNQHGVAAAPPMTPPTDPK